MTTLHKDFKEFIALLNGKNIKYVLVGAHALAQYGISRITKDIDFFCSADDTNLRDLATALVEFGMPPHAFPYETLKDAEMIQLGFPPVRIDLLFDISGVSFEEAWESAAVREIDGLKVPMLSRELLIRNKRASGREQDLLDVKNLERMK